jgi:hypothetical protein
MRLSAFLARLQLIPALLALLLAAPALGANDDRPRTTLKGIDRLGVYAQVSPLAESLGLSTSQVQNDVELRLRQSGILVVPIKDIELPWLAVTINATKATGTSAYAYNISVELRQLVSLFRNEFLCHASTWEKSYVVSMVGGQDSSLLRSTLSGLVDMFLNAYLEQNPKP